MPTKGLSPTQRTLRELRQRGVIVAIVERWNQFGGPFGIRQDLWGFGDALALYPEYKGVTAIQCCARSGLSAHRTKILENEIAPEFLKAENRIEIWAWGKVKKVRGGKLMVYKPVIEEITLQNYESPHIPKS
jgi:hypothetical protein